MLFSPPVTEVAGVTKDCTQPGVGTGASLQLIKLLFGQEPCSSRWAACAVPLLRLNNGIKEGLRWESAGEEGRRVMGQLNAGELGGRRISPGNSNLFVILVAKSTQRQNGSVVDEISLGLTPPHSVHPYLQVRPS